MKQDLLDELGIKLVVNTAGTVTVLGSCLVHDEILNVVRQVTKIFVDTNDLHNKVRAFVARLVESDAYVTSGTAAGLVLSVGSLYDECRRRPNA